MRFRTLLCMALTVFAVAPIVCAQRYTRIPIEEKLRDPKEIKRYHRTVARVYSGQADWDEQAQRVLNNYYQRTLLPALTDPMTYGGNFGEWRMELQKDLANARVESARVYTIGRLSSMLRQVSGSDKFHPITRFNALLFLGDLNEKEAVLRGTPAPPVPLSKALGDFYRIVKAPDSPGYLRMGALLGLRRHVKLRTLDTAPKPLPAQQKSAIAKTVADLLDAPATSDQDQAAHDWLRRRAVETLGFLADAGDSGSIAKKVFAMMLEESAELDLRCAAAEALASMDLKTASMSPQELSRALGTLARDCTQHEIDVLKEFLMSNGMGGEGRGYTPNIYGQGENFNGNDEIVFSDPNTVPSRRRLLARLEQLQTAMQGNPKLRVPGVVQTVPDTKASIDAMAPVLTTILDAAKDPETVGVRGLGKVLVEGVESLETHLATLGDAPAADPTAATALN